MVLIDSYWRANGEPFCPAADGLSHHINPAGQIEPCPVIQLTRENIDGELVGIYENSAFIKDLRNDINKKTNGCILMEDPQWLKAFSEKHDAMNSSGRPEYFEDLVNAPVLVSHGSCPVIPEKNLIYRIAKKTAFFGMGAYG
jgi:hypothetical protein